MSANENEWGPWLDWDGSADMPPGVAGDDDAQVWLRADSAADADDVESTRLTYYASGWSWTHGLGAIDIIRYRLRADHPVYGSRKTVRHVGLFIELHEYKTGHAFLLNKRHIAAVQADRNVGGSWVTMPPIGEEDWSYHVSESYKHISAAMADIPLPEAVTVQGEVSDG